MKPTTIGRYTHASDVRIKTPTAGLSVFDIAPDCTLPLLLCPAVLRTRPDAKVTQEDTESAHKRLVRNA